MVVRRRCVKVEGWGTLFFLRLATERIWCIDVEIGGPVNSSHVRCLNLKLCWYFYRITSSKGKVTSKSRLSLAPPRQVVRLGL